MELVFIWRQATPEAKIIIVFLIVFSIMAWSVMAAKALQMRRAKKLNLLFDAEFHRQQTVMGMYERRIEVEGCPLFAVYKEGCSGLETRLKAGGVTEDGRLAPVRRWPGIRCA